jgi:hypothetical protein
MMFPARMKKGMAMSTGLSIPVKMRWDTSTSGVSPSYKNATRGVSPNTKAMGTPIMRKREKEMRRIMINTGDSQLLVASYGQVRPNISLDRR